MVSKSSSIGGSKCFYELFGCKLGFRLGLVVIWRHDAKHLIAPDGSPSGDLPRNGRAPAFRLSLVGDYRIFGDVGHHRIAFKIDLAPMSLRCQRLRGIATSRPPLCF